ncbi:hypothetical protein PROAA_510022 [Candidatus Propionivibrio aalborgensis]|uniref:Uncharacterized protein n=1 Tax=Candidatus Propionivibrio aalborgensis TaxID=1860101 RepID=A0A1A8Y288_9RHOO|nr:hypothetical protein PROAA_510022 [Candidatus Propionivibrio aalborgensis]
MNLPRLSHDSFAHRREVPPFSGGRVLITVYTSRHADTHIDRLYFRDSARRLRQCAALAPAVVGCAGQERGV